MISTKNLKENDQVFIWLGYPCNKDFEEIGGIKLEATFRNDKSVTANNDIYGSSVYKYEKKVN